ncbi:NRSN1 protein, partial [Larus smithsonianus]|nr:NRSN1 protein [Larus smithsonianus]
QVGRMSSYADNCVSKHAQGSTEGGYQHYGVWSYVHQFYEDCTASIWEYEDDFRIQRLPGRWSSMFWKVGLISRTAFLLIGLTVLVVGFLVPPKIEALGKDDFVVVDTHVAQFNGSLDICKLAGAILFCVGGSTVAACLLMSA